MLFYFVLYVADPATFLASNSVLDTLFLNIYHFCWVIIFLRVFCIMSQESSVVFMLF